MTKIRVLFLCTHNSARSQMAEGLLRHFYWKKYEVFSAGSSPTQVHPFAIRVMSEIGIDISKQVSKSIEEFQKKEIDVVVTVCSNSAKIACPFCSSPILNGRPEIIRTMLPRAKHYLHQDFNDPSEINGSDQEKIAIFRHTRDDIKKWVLNFFADFKINNLDNHA
jgi:arsenate reductase